MKNRQPEAGHCHRVADGVLRLTAPNPGPMTGPGTNTYLVGDRETVVIDPGVDDPQHLQAVMDHAPGPIRDILITHKHPDHTGGAMTLAQRTGALIRAHATPLQAAFDPDFVADETLSAGQVFQAGAHRLETVATPGHAVDHVGFFLREQGLFFVGDTLMAGVTVVIIPPDGDMRAYFDTLTRLRDMPISAFAPAHGHMLTDPVAEIDHVLAHRRAREDQLLTVLAEASAPVADLAARIYPQTRGTLRRMAEAQLLAHLLGLAESGRVRQCDDERWQLL